MPEGNIMLDALGVDIHPISDQLTRERVFTVAELREDGRDAFGQIQLLLGRVKSEKFTGEVSIVLNQGGIQHVRLRQSQKIKQ